MASYHFTSWQLTRLTPSSLVSFLAFDWSRIGTEVNKSLLTFLCSLKTLPKRQTSHGHDYEHEHEQ